MIKLTNVTKSYGHEKVLDNVCAFFRPGQIHGIIGRNGSGKTVLLKCIAGLTTPDHGTIRIGRKVIGRDVETPPRLGAIIETPGFLPNYSGFLNLKLLADIRGRIEDDEICDAMERVGLDPDSRKHVSKYSLGMRQRLGIAQALMERPRLLILDEPMNGLDNEGVEDMRKLFLHLRAQGVTIIIASHNPLDIHKLCDHVYAMDAGRLTSIR